MQVLIVWNYFLILLTCRLFFGFMLQQSWKLNTFVSDKWSSFVLMVFSGYLIFIYLCLERPCVFLPLHNYLFFFPYQIFQVLIL